MYQLEQYLNIRDKVNFKSKLRNWTKENRVNFSAFYTVATYLVLSFQAAKTKGKHRQLYDPASIKHKLIFREFHSPQS